MYFNKTSMLILFILLSWKSVQITSGESQNAVIYSSLDRKGPALHWSEHSEWSDLANALQKGGLEVVEQVCVNGTWLIYRKPHFMTENGEEDYTIVSGINKCVEPEEMGSAQPFGKMDSARTPSLTLFKENEFGSVGVPITTSRSAHKLQQSLGGPPKSMITVGRSPWSFKSVQGGKRIKIVCIQTDFGPSETVPICLIPDLKTFGIDGELVSIERGCKNKKAETRLSLHRCQYFDASHTPVNQTIKPNVPTPEQVVQDSDEQIRKGRGAQEEKKEEGKQKEQKYDGDCDKDKAKVEILTQLLSIRLNHDFTSPLQLLWPTKMDHIWRTKMLDSVYDIAMAVTPPNTVPHEYMMMIREFMVYRLSNAWQREKENHTSASNYFMEMVVSDLKQCEKEIIEFGHIILDMNEEYWMSPGPKSMFKNLQRNHDLDIVIDTTYVVANMVLGLCHHLLENSPNNFWANYINTFITFYLDPVLDEWKTPRVEDEFILGGYDFDSQYRKLAAFTTTMLMFTPNMRPFERPLPPMAGT